MGAFVVLVVLATMAGAFTWLLVRGRELERQRDLARAVHARKAGWTYDGRRAGRIDYRFAGDAEGISWQLWLDSDRGDDSPTPRAYWKSGNLRTPALALVVIGRRRFELESGLVGQLLMGVATGVAQSIVGSGGRGDKSEFYQNAIELDQGRPGFRERFAVVIAPDMPRDWFDEELQSLLLQWPAVALERQFKSEDGIEITLSAEGLQVVAQRMPEEFACWEHLARLGVHVARRLAPTCADTR